MLPGTAEYKLAPGIFLLSGCVASQVAGLEAFRGLEDDPGSYRPPSLSPGSSEIKLSRKFVLPQQSPQAPGCISYAHRSPSPDRLCLGTLPEITILGQIWWEAFVKIRTGQPDRHWTRAHGVVLWKGLAVRPGSACLLLGGGVQRAEAHHHGTSGTRLRGLPWPATGSCSHFTPCFLASA